MVSSTIKISTVTAGLALVAATELIGWRVMVWLQLSPLAVVGAVRTIQMAGFVWIVNKWERGLVAVGWGPGTWLSGLKKGAFWSMAFAAAAGVGMAAAHLAGSNPLQMVRSPLPSRSWELGLFFLVGGFIAPMAEEFLFRGILYTFFRRWGIICALAVSTAIFVVLHLPAGIPYTQIVGGIVFALAYETTGNLSVPMTIHCLGNLAIFTLSLL